MEKSVHYQQGRMQGEGNRARLLHIVKSGEIGKNRKKTSKIILICQILDLFVVWGWGGKFNFFLTPLHQPDS